MSREIPLTNGLVTIVDDEDYDWLSQWPWFAKRVVADGNVLWYAVGHMEIWTEMKRMHRVIMGVSNPRIKVDHIEHGEFGGLDNRRSNLRIADMSQQGANTRKQTSRNGNPLSSQFKGVHWREDAQKWRAYINWRGKRTYLGYFVQESDAAKAYDVKAAELFGEFARLNFPEGE